MHPMQDGESRYKELDNMKSLVVILVMLFSAVNVLAYSSNSGTFVSISNIRAYEGDFVLFKAPSSKNDDGCSATSGWIQLDIKTDAQKRQFSMLLSARMANMPVMLYYNGCSGGYRLVEQVQI